MRRGLTTTMLAVVVAVVALAGAGSARAATTWHVVADQDRFNDSDVCGDVFRGSNLEITRGDSVQWRNCDTGRTHTVTWEGNAYPRQVLARAGTTGDRIVITFDRLGTFRYFCDFHRSPAETGSVRVVAPGDPTTTSTTAPGATTTTTTTAPRPTTTSTSSSTTSSTTTTTVAPTTTRPAPTTTPSPLTSEAGTTTTLTALTTDVAGGDRSDGNDKGNTGLKVLLIVLALAVFAAVVALVAYLVGQRRAPGQPPMP